MKSYLLFFLNAMAGPVGPLFSLKTRLLAGLPVT